MNPILAVILKWFWGAGARFIEVAVIAVILIGGPFMIYHAGYSKAARQFPEQYQKGYNQALTDHPQQVYNAPATVNNNPPKTSAIYGLKLGRSWGVGVCHE